MKAGSLYVDATPGSIAYVTEHNGIQQYNCHILNPKLTTNEAEYQSLIEGLEYCLIEGYDILEIYSDSEIVVKQILKKYRTRRNLIPFNTKALELLHQFYDWNIQHIKGTENPADFYSRKGLNHDKA